MERIVLTVMSVISPIENDMETFWNHIIAWNSGITKINTLDTTDLKIKIVGNVKKFSEEKAIGKKASRNLNHFF